MAPDTKPKGTEKTDAARGRGRSKLRRVALPLTIVGAAGAAAYAFGKANSGEAQPRTDGNAQRDEGAKQQGRGLDRGRPAGSRRASPPRDPQELEAARRERQARREERRKRATA